MGAKKSPTKRGSGNGKVVLTEDEIKEAGRLAGLGLNMDQISLMLSVSSTCLDEIMRRQPEVKRAILKGRIDSAIPILENLHGKAATSDNPTWALFYCKTRLGWKDESSANTIVVSANQDNVADLVRAARKGLEVAKAGDDEES
jgi:hypothetical protein